ncbi:MAG: outer membrane beta-barrel protein [Deltaproteobacteria bacterium]
MTRFFLILCFFIFSVFSLSAQYGGSRSMINYLYHKAKPYYFGISLGYDNSNLFLKKSNYFVDESKYLVVEPSSGVGFHVQMIVNLKLGETYDLRVLPGFSFADKKIDYYDDLTGNLRTDKKFESVFIDIPIIARYKSAPYNDMRAFVLAGIRYSYDVNSNTNDRNNQDLIKISPHDFMFEVGGGLQFFFPYFIFSPEIKLSTGIGNVLQYDKELKESKVLEKILSKGLSISFHFEG